jgi:hypothetical protein
MSELESFTWKEMDGTELRFEDLTESEQRVALIAAGALVRGGRRRVEVKQVEPAPLQVEG